MAQGDGDEEKALCRRARQAGTRGTWGGALGEGVWGTALTWSARRRRGRGAGPVGHGRHAFDVASLERYAVGRVPGLTAPLTVRQFKIGPSNPTFLLVDALGQRFVMRKKPAGKLVATAHMVEREYQVLRALKTVDFPVPTVYCLCEDPAVVGTAFYVRLATDAGRVRCDGRAPMLRPTAHACALPRGWGVGRRLWSFWSGASSRTRRSRTCPPRTAPNGLACGGGAIAVALWRRGSLTDRSRLCAPRGSVSACASYASLVSTLARLHSIDFRRVGLEGFGRAGDYYKRQVARMETTSRQQEIAGVVPPLPHIDELLRWYTAHMPEDFVTIVHGDYKFDNVIFHPTENRIIGVLDWEMSTIGHPFSDLANMSLPFYQDPGYAPPMVRVADIPGVPTAEDVLRRYCEAAGRPYPFAGWNFCISFAFFRVRPARPGSRRGPCRPPRLTLPSLHSPRARGLPRRRSSPSSFRGSRRAPPRGRTATRWRRSSGSWPSPSPKRHTSSCRCPSRACSQDGRSVYFFCTD